MKKLILFLILEEKKKSSRYSEQTSKALLAWERAARTDKKYISKIQSYVNRNDQNFPTSDDIIIRVGQIIKGTLTPKGEEKPAQKVVEPPEKETSIKKQKSAGIMSQIPEGDLKKKSPFSLDINGKRTQVRFTSNYIQMNNKKFKFNSI